MRKLISMLLALTLLLSLPAALAEGGGTPYTCQQQGYTTLVDPAWRVEWVDDDGTYFHFTDVNMPYVLAWVDTDDDRVRDGAAFLEDLLPRLQESYRQNGAVSTALHGSFSVAGRSVAAADIQYRNSQGVKIYLLIVEDVQEDYTATYRARYLEEDGRQQALDALDLIAGNLHLNAAGTDQPRQEAASTGVHSLAVTDIREYENGFGRCVAPEGYEVQWGHICCTTSESYSNPHHLGIIASNDEHGVMMRYLSTGDFLSGTDGSTAYDGEFNKDYHTPMLHYMNASDYCDYVAATWFPELADGLQVVSSDDCPEAQQALNRLAQSDLARQRNETGWLGLITIDGNEYSICRKRFYVEYMGTPHHVEVLTACLGTWITVGYDGLKLEGGKMVYGRIENRWISWEVPFIYVLTCPLEHWDEGSAAFEQFTANTRASDQFDEANRKLAKALWDIVAGTMDLTAGKSTSEKTMREETDGGEDYDDERVTDYIFDQNDYTLSDGSHVKVSTAYDYVYEGDNGTVYYSDSAFAQPGGSTQLYPNR